MLKSKPRAHPRHDHDEDARQQHLRAVEHRADSRDLDAFAAHVLRSSLVARDELGLAAYSPQDAQTRHGVGAEVRQLADRSAQFGLPVVQRPEQRRDEEHQ